MTNFDLFSFKNDELVLRFYSKYELAESGIS